eukprot:CAMPEP_0172639330 /NCGR_PEP_ID=MMETSP1068-20121228/218087_1 /TAXON_ID=35684 /ORGANISM="Pseudopedinella elastica, Strain CCMP716" /LENGTH=130 /DNA_ID=CAMNT_0013452441 /DNA_START=255 /DNA_END=644 /DNA_ORIENTATION=-
MKDGVQGFVGRLFGRKGHEDLEVSSDPRSTAEAPQALALSRSQHPTLKELETPRGGQVFNVDPKVFGLALRHYRDGDYVFVADRASNKAFRLESRLPPLPTEHGRNYRGGYWPQRPPYREAATSKARALA